VPAMNGFERTNAFVVQFRAGGHRAMGELSGKVEHVASGKTANFQSVQELPQLLLQMLQAWRADRDAEDQNRKTR
jgi:hypothetical protein